MLAAVVASWRCCVNLVTVLALVSVPVAKARSRGVFRGPAHSVGMLGCKWSPILCAMALAHAKAVEPQSRTCRPNRRDSGAAAAAVRPFGGMSGLLWAARANLQAEWGFVVAAQANRAAYCVTGGGSAGLGGSCGRMPSQLNHNHAHTAPIARSRGRWLLPFGHWLHVGAALGRLGRFFASSLGNSGGRAGDSAA